MFRKNNQPYATIGTTQPIFIPNNDDPKPVRPGRDYFLVQILNAQASFTGSIWQHVERLLVMSQVNINHPIIGNESLRAIQRSREVRKERAEQLGLSPNLVTLIPASMTHFSVSLEFVLDKKNRMHALSSLINDDSFLATVSLAPGAVMVAKTVGGLAQKVITTFIPAQEREEILKFNGDFNLAAKNLYEGYYVILGTRDEKNPIPNPIPKLDIQDGELLANGERVTQLSYVILDVRRTEARTRDLNEGAQWEGKLREAEDEAQRVKDDPFTTDEERKQTWDKCKNLLQEAQILLRSDLNFHRHEASCIIKAAFLQCSDALNISQESQPAGGIIKASRYGWQPDIMADRSFLDISPEEDLKADNDDYAKKVATSRALLQGLFSN